jgi:hypothetical protein
MRPAPGETSDDFRARREAERLHDEELRQRQLFEQSSLDHSPDVRIRAWDNALGLRIPSKRGHPALRVIATATGSPLEVVVDQQRRRTQCALEIARRSMSDAAAKAVVTPSPSSAT